MSRMGSIYQQSTLTLMARHGDDADSGLGVLRDPRSTKPCKFDFVFTAHTGEHYEVEAHATLNSYRETRDPLDHPGWTLQEKVLARRILSFGSAQLSWSCQATHASEHQPDVDRRPALESQYMSCGFFEKAYALAGRRSNCHTSSAAITSFGSSRKDVFDGWQSLIVDYS
jgi:hypothetical protein